jgi:hypothetical protein
LNWLLLGPIPQAAPGRLVEGIAKLWKGGE